MARKSYGLVLFLPEVVFTGQSDSVARRGGKSWQVPQQSLGPMEIVSQIVPNKPAVKAELGILGENPGCDFALR